MHDQFIFILIDLSLKIASVFKSYFFNRSAYEEESHPTDVIIIISWTKSVLSDGLQNDENIK